MSKENNSNYCVSEALFELKVLQDLITNTSTKYFGKLLPKMIGTDTIPFLLITKDGPYTQMGMDVNKLTGKEECFKTNYFRIESINKGDGCVTISLLRPLDIFGDDAQSLCDVTKLKKTPVCVEIDLSCICAVQPLDIDFLKKKIIIEPKW